MSNIPKKHKACVFDKPGEISIRVVEVDTPEPQAGEVLIKLTHSGVCHSDLGIMTNTWARLPFPTAEGQVGGHEGVGEIVKMGPGTENAAVKVGQRVGVKWVSAICDTCPPCLAGHDALCLNCKVSGYYTPGTFQQYVTGPASYVTPIPDALESAAAAPLLCAGVTCLSALRKARVHPGDWVVLLGCGGGLGHLASQIAANGMALNVIGIDHGSKRELSLKSGVTHFIDHTQCKDVGAEVKSLTDGLGAQAVLVLTAANGAYASALSVLKFGGTLVCVGLPEGEPVAIAGAYPQDMVNGELTIVGSAVGNRLEAIKTMEMAARGKIATHFRTCKMDELEQTFHDMHAMKIKGRVVLELDQ